MKWGLLPLLLVACAQVPGQPLRPDDYSVPALVPRAVTLLLPRGVTRADVREDAGCYAYVFRDALLYPVQRPNDGGQYCI